MCHQCAVLDPPQFGAEFVELELGAQFLFDSIEVELVRFDQDDHSRFEADDLSAELRPYRPSRARDGYGLACEAFSDARPIELDGGASEQVLVVHFAHVMNGDVSVRQCAE